jgi:hypothetical protein
MRRPVPDTVTRAAEQRVLSAVEFDVVWDGLGLGPTPVVLSLASPGRSHTERRRIEAGGWTALRERGLAGPGGLESELERLLRLLAVSPVRLELRAWWPAMIRAVAAGDEETVVLARRADDAVVLEPCTSLADVAGVLPPGTAGPGRAANVPTAELDGALRRPSGAGLRADLVERGVTPAEAGLASRMLDGVDRRGQIDAVVADRWAAPQRWGEGIGVLEGPRGRYLTTRSHADDGTAWTTIAPTDDRRLRQRVADLVDDARAGQPQSRSPWRISCRPDSVIEPDSDG